jgi:hypothetical protein
MLSRAPGEQAEVPVHLEVKAEADLIEGGLSGRGHVGLTKGPGVWSELLQIQWQSELKGHLALKCLCSFLSCLGGFRLSGSLNESRTDTIG